MPDPQPPDAAIILAGGRSRRMGGDVVKPLLRLAGTPLLSRVLAALPPRTPTVVVGEVPLELPPNVRVVSEDPPGAGPAYALATGLAAIPSGTTHVYVLAADLPLLTGASLALLRAGLDSSDRPQWRSDIDTAEAADRPQWRSGMAPAEAAYAELIDHPQWPTAAPDGAVYVDSTNRPQWLCGCWRVPVLRAVGRDVLPGASLRSMLGVLRRTELRWTSPGPPPYFDCDTPDALAEAERLLGGA